MNKKAWDKKGADWVDGYQRGLEEAREEAEKERLIVGETSVKFDPECIQETKEQPEVALRKMHNAACDNIVERIRALEKQS